MGTFDWLAGAPAGDPLSQNAMALRQRMALAMLERGKKGYPKNLGEGLTAVGDAFGDRSQMQQILAQQAAFERATQAEKAKAEAGGGKSASATPAVQTAAVDPASWLNTAQYQAPPPQATASASPFPDVAGPVATTATALAGGGDDAASPSLSPTPPVQNASVPTQLASLAGGSTMSDADPLPATVPQQPSSIQQAPPSNLPQDPALRDRMAATLQARQGGPQPNPMLGGQSPAAMPSTFSPDELGSPLDLNNRPIVLPGVQQLAEAGAAKQSPRIAPAPEPSRVPGPAEPPPAALGRPGGPGAFTEEPKNDAQIRAEAAARKYKDFNTPLYDTYSDMAAKEEAKRKDREAARKATWDAAKTQEQQQLGRWETEQYGMDEKNARTLKAQSEAAQAADAAAIATHNGVPFEQVHTDLMNRRKEAETNVSILRNAKIAREMVNAGVISGFGADAQINWERAKAFFGDVPAAELVARSQLAQAAVKATIGYGLQQYQPGDPRVTNSDLIAGQSITGGSPEQQLETRKSLINLMIDESHKKINDYEKVHDERVGGFKAENYYRLRTEPLDKNAASEKIWTDILLKPENRDSQNAKDIFDEKYGPGAAQLVIDRAERRARRGR